MPDEWIRQWGDPTLRLVAAPVTAVDEILHRQVTRMMRRLEESAGAGLAATQVGVMRRVFVFRLSVELDVDVLVNPRIVSRSADRVIFHEGCMSFNAVTVAVERSAALRVEGQDLAGRARAFEVADFGASLVQHEIDHLDGILTLDRAAAEERRRAVRILLAPASADHRRAA